MYSDNCVFVGWMICKRLSHSICCLFTLLVVSSHKPKLINWYNATCLFAPVSVIWIRCLTSRYRHLCLRIFSLCFLLEALYFQAWYSDLWCILLFIYLENRHLVLPSMFIKETILSPVCDFCVFFKWNFCFVCMDLFLESLLLFWSPCLFSYTVILPTIVFFFFFGLLFSSDAVP